VPIGVDETDRVKTPERQPDEWKVLLPASIFMTGLAVYSTLVGLVALALIGSITGTALAFVAGYFYRADPTTSRPWFLRARGD
jgi:hypothetical protein